MKTLEMAKATAPLAQYAEKAAKEPLVLTVDGKPMMALVSVANADWDGSSP